MSWLAMKSRLESRLILSAGMSLVVLVDAFLKVAIRGGAGIATAAQGIRASA